MQQMKAQQASFASMFGDGVDDDSDGDTAGGDGDECMSDTSGDKEEEAVSFGTCIVCQEDLNGAGGKLFGALGLIQPSRLVRRHPDGQNWHLNDVLASSFSMDRTVVNIGAGTPGNTSGMSPSTTFPPSQADLLDSKATSPNFEGFPSNYTRFGLHSSVCSHMMHLDCFQVCSVYWATASCSSDSEPS
jgi:E3 ubiquitin-protein ligase UBR1